jgi:two-component system chemotaxis response regulator CheY
MKVLVADDSATIRALLKAHLRHIQVDEVLEARDGNQVLQIVAKTAVDAILLDLDMPELDGIDTIVALKHRTQDRPLPPIIVISAQADRSAKEQAHAAGAQAFLAKPFSAESLRTVLAAVVPQFPSR